MNVQEKRDTLEKLAPGINHYLPDGWSLVIQSADNRYNDHQFFKKGRYEVWYISGSGKKR